jgi:ribonuclease Z
MRTLFHPSLLHPSTGDPGAWVDVPDEGRAVLFDLPELSRVAPRKLLRLAHAVVTHTHMDHFVGFDQLLRVALRREALLAITGPPGFLASVRGRIGAYTWNLVAGYPIHLRVQEVEEDTVRAEEYTGASRMRPVPLPEAVFSGTIHAERAFRIEVATFDHGIPVLGVVLRETRHLGVNKDLLVRRGLVPGPWLGELKDAIRSGAVENTEGLIVEGPGQVVAYLTDLAGTDENLRRAAAFVCNADLLLCEAAFLDADRALAIDRKHLTARQAGTLAREAGVKRLAVFHISSRYEGREAEVLREAAEAFGAPLLEMG